MFARIFPVVLATAPVALAQDQPATAKIDFATAIAPIFAKHCYECHGPKEHEADLRLDQRASLFHKDEAKWVVKPGKPQDSELVRRIKLPKTDDDVMPAEGNPLSAADIAAIEQWIGEGALWPETAGDKSADAPAPTVETFALDLTPAQKEQVDAAVGKLHERGGVAAPIAHDLVALDVNLSLLRPAAGDADLALAAAAAPALVWLNVARTQITDQGMAALATCTNLRRLHLAQTEVGDDGLRHLAGMHDLRFLNLFGTKVTDRGLAHLHGLAKLEKVFLWQTAVTDAGVAALQKALPKLHVDRGDYAQDIAKVAAESKAAESKAAENKAAESKDADKQGAEHDAATPKAGAAKAGAAPVNDKCPVSGQAVDAAVTSTHDGRTIAFCCTKCRAKFEADPSKFVANLPAKTEAKK